LWWRVVRVVEPAQQAEAEVVLVDSVLAQVCPLLPELTTQ
jgi:hypothetical protein